MWPCDAHCAAGPQPRIARLRQGHCGCGRTGRNASLPAAHVRSSVPATRAHVGDRCASEGPPHGAPRSLRRACVRPACSVVCVYLAAGRTRAPGHYRRSSEEAVAAGSGEPGGAAGTHNGSRAESRGGAVPSAYILATGACAWRVRGPPGGVAANAKTIISAKTARRAKVRADTRNAGRLAWPMRLRLLFRSSRDVRQGAGVGHVVRPFVPRHALVVTARRESQLKRPQRAPSTRRGVRRRRSESGESRGRRQVQRMLPGQD
ncbi:hypothetical protein ERJ75_000499600 [Trypanosoma vivax]|uniref:Uncharacterized protein n=1 Tax=Trypanosoma vivax (strain Y486) TaxID=1055687 RepID=F9WMB8_TRYVY|nr:hypothetical protein ERJ75_000499600 [Trypanosoma vivax]CCD18671.1 hypothetical protein TvY486_0013700 [Trypanosoma vivax Y486]|eukprot:CCD18671.1 hypothetical protein TvY486_0013700 [Trypanosoma vivax Y486]